MFVENYIPIHEALLQKNGSNGHYLGDTTTYVDIAVVIMLNFLEKVFPGLMTEAKAPNLFKVVAAVKADKNFANYKPFQKPS